MVFCLHARWRLSLLWMRIDYVSWSVVYAKQHVVWITPFVYSIHTDELSSHNTSCAYKPVKCQRKKQQAFHVKITVNSCRLHILLAETGKYVMMLARSCTGGMWIRIEPNRYSSPLSSPLIFYDKTKKHWLGSEIMCLIVSLAIVINLYLISMLNSWHYRWIMVCCIGHLLLQTHSVVHYIYI